MAVFAKGAVWNIWRSSEYGSSLTNELLFYNLACRIKVCLQKTSQLIGKANRLVGFYIVWIFAEDCFRTEKKSFYYNNCGEFIPGENVDCRPIILLKKEILCRFFCVFCLNLSYICFIPDCVFVGKFINEGGVYFMKFKLL